MKLQHLFATMYRYALLSVTAIGLVAPCSAAEDGFTFGGAVRFNLFAKDFEDALSYSDVQATFDTWRLNVRGRKNGFKLDFEYRFYPTFGTHFIHHGWFGYDISDKSSLELGVTQVPFGDLTYASHSWWFSTAYYVGLEDDYDMGLKYVYDTDAFDMALAYFYMPEPSGPAPTAVEEWPSYGIGGSGRYSYDIIPADGASISERHQINARVAYLFGEQDGNNAEVGLSGQFGTLYNSALDGDAADKHGVHTAAAAHVDANVGNFNAKAHAIYFNHLVDNDDGEQAKLVNMGAYGSGTYQVAAEALMFTAGFAYTIPVNKKLLSSIQFYDDFTYTYKTNTDFEPTMQNTLGMLLATGPIYTYVDIASGVNHPWLTNSFGTGLGEGVEDAGWNTRLNVNIGYYF